MLHQLWGIDGVLSGHERSILSILPVVRIKGDKTKVAVARTAEWSLPATGPVNAKIDYAERVAEYVDKLKLPPKVLIAEGLMMVLVGPEYQRACSIAYFALDVSKRWGLQAGGWLEVQSGFAVRACSLEQYKALAAQHGGHAQRVFDVELMHLLGWKVPDEIKESVTLTPKAEAALLMLMGNSQVPYAETVIREMLAAKVTRDTEGFRRLHLLAETELKASDVVVDLLYGKYLQTITA